MKYFKNLRLICGLTLGIFGLNTLSPYLVMADHGGNWAMGGQQVGNKTNLSGDPQPQGSQQPPPCSQNKSAGSSNPSGPTLAALSVGDPVYVHSGEFYYNCVDLSIPGKGMDLDIVHSYRSGRNNNGPFGFGWTINYYERLKPLDNGNLVLLSGTGRSDEYVFDGTKFIPPAGFFETLVKNDDGTATITDSHGNTKNYDLNGNLQTIKDRFGNQITLTYDAGGALPILSQANFGIPGSPRGVVGMDYRLTKITDTVGREMNFTYNADGLLESLTDFTGRRVSFAYDPATNDLIKITKPATPQFPAGITKTFTYDASHNVISMKDGKDQTVVTNTYDAQGRIISQNLGGNTLKLSYPTSPANSTIVVDRRGIQTTWTFNADGLPLIRNINPISNVTNYTYNANLEMTSIKYPTGSGIKFVYDETNPDVRQRGNLLSVRRKTSWAAADNDLNDLVTKIIYEPNFNFPKTVTDPNGNVSTYIYDYELPSGDPKFGTAGKLIRINDPSVGTQSPQVNFSYDSAGQLTEVLDANGNKTAYAYGIGTEAGYLKQIARDPDGINAVMKFNYDVFGSVVSVVDFNNRTTSFSRNPLGWMIESIDPLDFKTKFTYDANGNVTKVERQAESAGTVWQITQYTYDVLNNLLTVTDPLNRMTTYSYDPDDNVAAIKDPLNRVTSYLYDQRNFIFKVTDANDPAGVTQYEYDQNGNLMRLIDAKGNATNYSYDGFNRLAFEAYSYPGGVRYFKYDKNSNITQIQQPSTRSIQFVYDALNRLTNRTYSTTSENNVVYSYDAGSRLTQMTNNSATDAFAYDALDRTVAATQTLNGKSYTLTYAYDPAGNQIRNLYPSGKDLRYTYDGNNRMTAIETFGAPNVPLAVYSYDPLGRRIQRDVTDGGAMKSSAYAYDLAGQLLNVTNATPGGPTISKFDYTYDPAGNRTTMAALNVGTTKNYNYTYNNIDELTRTTGAQTHVYAYDKVANRTTVDGMAYTSNTQNQYATVAGVTYKYDGDSNLTFDGTNTYTFDEEDRIISSVGGGNTASYKYDGFNRRVAKTVNGVTTSFVYDDDEIVEERDAAGALVAHYVYGPQLDEVLNMNRAGTNYYYAQDGLDSVVNLLNSAGVSVENYEYDVYGQPSAPSTAGNPIQFTGRWYDKESGNYDYRARMYSPKIGRFLQRDPIGYGDSMNLFQYVGNNPINWIDSFGEKHNKGKRKSTKGKHQQGQETDKRNKFGGEKGDKNRFPPGTKRRGPYAGQKPPKKGEDPPPNNQGQKGSQCPAPKPNNPGPDNPIPGVPPVNPAVGQPELPPVIPPTMPILAPSVSVPPSPPLSAMDLLDEGDSNG